MINNVNHARRQEACEALESVMLRMKDLVEEARDAVRDHPSYDNWDAYVFRQFDESLENCNPYNQSIYSIIDRLNVDGDKKDAEPIEAWGETWEEDNEF